MAKTLAYDALGRVQSTTNNLGQFDYAYVNETSRVATIDYPNGQQVVYDYFDDSGDFRLKQIKNLGPGTTPPVISQFDYTYDANGRIATWTKMHSGLTDPQRFEPVYDPIDQLVGGVLYNDTTEAIIEEYVYGYDAAGNRTEEQIGASLVDDHGCLGRSTAF